jgi:tetratricopeptide (TPR) repeat protein
MKFLPGVCPNASMPCELPLNLPTSGPSFFFWFRCLSVAFHMIFFRLNAVIFRIFICAALFFAVMHFCVPLWAAIAPERDVVIIDNPEKSENPSWKNIWDEARKLSRDGRFVEAAAIYKKLLGIKPNIEEAKWEYCKVLVETKGWVEASIVLESLLEADPTRNDYLLKAGTVALNNKQYQQAVKYFGQVYEKNPHDPDATEALKGFISGLQGLGKKQNAFPLMEQLYLRTPNDSQLLQELAGLSQEFGWMEKARSYYTTLVAKFRVEDHILLQAALVHNQEGMDEKALPFWLKYLERQPNYLPFQQKVAEYYCKAGKMSLALPHLLVLYEKGAGNDDMLLQIGRIFMQYQERPDKALFYLEKYQKKHPDNQQIEAEIGKIQTVLANDLLSIVVNDGASILWRDLAKITPNRQAIYLVIADILEHLGKDKELFEVLDIVHTHNPRDKKVIWRLAELSFKKKNYNNAYSYIKLLEGSEKEIPQYQIFKANVEEILGNEHASLLSYSRYLESYPDDLQVRKRGLELAGRLGIVKQLYSLYQSIPKASTGSTQLFELEDIYIEGLINNGIYSDAQNLSHELLKRGSNDTKKVANIRLRQADSYYMEGLVFEAEQIVRQMLADNIEVSEALKKLIEMAIKGGDFTWAKTWLSLLSAKTGVNFLVKNYTEWPEELFYLKLELTIAEQGYDTAIDMLKEYLGQLEKKALDTSKKIKAEQRLCRLLFHSRQYEKCEFYIHQILNKDPDDIEMLVMLGNIKDIRLGEGQEGRDEYTIDIAKIRTFSSLMKAAALEYEYGAYEKGMYFVHNALKDIPDSVNARILEGKIFIAKNDYGQALNIFRTLSQEFPQQEYFNRQILELEFKRGNFKKIVGEIPTEQNKESDFRMLADGNYRRSDSFWQRLILARALWADGQWEAAIKAYESLLIMPVDALFLQKMEVAQVNLHLPPLKRSFWNIITFSNPQNPDPITTVMDPAFIGSHIGLPIDTIAAGLYGKYRWQKLIENELSAKQAIKRRDYHQAEKEYIALIKKGDSDKAFYDLAKVYGHLELYGKAGELYEKLKKSGSEYPELDELVRQNNLKRMPRLSMDYSFLNEKGRNGYIDIKKTTCGLEGWSMPAFNKEIDIRVDRNSYIASDTINEIWSTRIIGAYTINISNDVDMLMNFGGNFADSYANSLYKLQLKGRLDQFLSGNIAIGQEVIEDTVQALRDGLYYRDYETGLKIDYFPRLVLGADFRYREYSDSNYQNWYHLWTSYDLFKESSLLQLKYEYGTMQNSRSNLGRDNDYTTDFLAGDLPYWSPDIYWQHLMTIRYKHDIETENISRAWTSYYTLEYSIGYETGREMIDSVGFNIFLEMSRHFLLKGNFKYYSAGDYSLNAAMLSVIYRW